jgi:hypothetical protein
MHLRTPGVQVRLADDGNWLAVQTANFETRILDLNGGSAVATPILPGRVHTNLHVEVAADGAVLHVAIGQFGHRFEWGTGELHHMCGKPRDLARRGPAPPELPRLAQYDPRRFLARPLRRMQVATDRLGHVLVFDRAGERLAAMFGVRRERAAAWLPDGTRWGAEEIGGTPSPGAAQRVAEALRAASKE